MKTYIEKNTILQEYKKKLKKLMRGHNNDSFFTKMIEYLSNIIISVAVAINKVFYLLFSTTFSEFCIRVVSWFKSSKPYIPLETDIKYVLRYSYVFLVQGSILRDTNLFIRLMSFFMPWYMNAYISSLTKKQSFFKMESKKIQSIGDNSDDTAITESVLILFMHTLFTNQKFLLNNFILENFIRFNSIEFGSYSLSDTEQADNLKNNGLLVNIFTIIKLFVVDNYDFYKKRFKVVLDLEKILSIVSSAILSLPKYFSSMVYNYWWITKNLYPMKWALGSNLMDVLFSGYNVTGHLFIIYKYKGSFYTLSSYYYNEFNGYYTSPFVKYVTKKYSYLFDHDILPVIPSKPIYFKYQFGFLPSVFLSKKLTHRTASDRDYSYVPDLFKSLYSFFKKTLVGLIIGLLFIAFSFFTFQLSFLKVIANWVFILLFAYWLFSGFNFFLKRYKYGKFTSAIQRFWKRAFMCFWMIEGFLFLLFFYYLLNSSSEPVFMYDQISLYTEQLLSWKVFLFNSMLTVVMINLVQIFLINLKSKTNRFSFILVFIITLFLLFILLTEGYQFYYIVNFYDEAVWVFSEEDNIWELEHDTPRTRTKNHYLTLCILAKFWHYIFIFLVWVFCLMKFFETGRISYTLVSINYQNLIIFYLMSWIFMFSWLKWFSRRFLDTQYFWFFSSYRDWHFKLLVNDFILCFTKIAKTLLNSFVYIKNSYTQLFFYIKALSTHNYSKDGILRNYFVQNSIAF